MRAVITGLLLTVVLGGCVAAPTHPPQTLVGLTLEAADAFMSDDTQLLVQDASASVDAEPQFDGSQLDSPGWTIVAACSSEKDIEHSATVEVAVVPAALYPKFDDADADRSITCEGLYR